MRGFPRSSKFTSLFLLFCLFFIQKTRGDATLYVERALEQQSVDNRARQLQAGTTTYQLESSLAFGLDDEDLDLPSLQDSQQLVRLTEIFFRRVFTSKYQDSFRSIDLQHESRAIDGNILTVEFSADIVFDAGAPPGGSSEVASVMVAGLEDRRGQAYRENWSVLVNDVVFSE